MTDLPVILRVQEFFLAISKITAKLPSLEKQTLGRRTEDKTLELLEILIMTKNAPKAMKAAYLIKATAANEILGFYLRILLEQKLANSTTLHQLIAKNTEIAQQIGGWRKSVQ
ncbi:four helix bundle protein [Candidatus Saccharibacteria bacterium]|nr:four helix bundle protein [Candidatus Saccharibacteria bacterium]